MDMAGGVIQRDVGEHGGVGFIRHVRAKTDAYIKRSVQRQCNGRAELVHRLAVHADVEREGVAGHGR